MQTMTETLGFAHHFFLDEFQYKSSNEGYETPVSLDNPFSAIELGSKRKADNAFGFWVFTSRSSSTFFQ